MTRRHSRKVHLVGGHTVTLCGRETYRLSRISTTNKGVDRSVCCYKCVIAEAEMERDSIAQKIDASIADTNFLASRVEAELLAVDGGATRRTDAIRAVARLREYCADYGYGIDVKESRGPAISAAMTGEIRVTFEVTVTVEEPDGAVRA